MVFATARRGFGPAGFVLLATALTFGSAPASLALWQDHEAVADCSGCHDGSDGDRSHLILETAHAALADPRSPMARAGCAGCHGDSVEHMRRPSRPPDRVFRNDGPTARDAQNRLCLECHRDAAMHWQGSAHDRQAMACGDCHRMHAVEDPVMHAGSEAEVCYGCHVEQRAQSLRPFNHPWREGRMRCGDCHAPHGSAGPAALTGRNTNETCYGCHAEMRGPFLWEHAPVREDCGNCHEPHGSSHRGMLTSRGPFLCQQCHMAQFHPGTLQSGSGLPTGATPSGSSSLLGQNCLNCHPAVHGSNHPSGAGLTR